MTVLSVGPEAIACLCGANLGKHLRERRQREESTHYTLVITEQSGLLPSEDISISHQAGPDLQELDTSHDHQDRVEACASEAKKWRFCHRGMRSGTFVEVV